jgi:hypothetical protein
MTESLSIQFTFTSQLSKINSAIVVHLCLGFPINTFFIFIDKTVYKLLISRLSGIPDVIMVII